MKLRGFLSEISRKNNRSRVFGQVVSTDHAGGTRTENIEPTHTN